MSGRTLLPGDDRLAGLFNQTEQADLCCAQQFRITRLHECREQNEEGSIQAGCCKNSYSDRIDIGMRRFFCIVGISKKMIERLGTVK